jgi:DNA-binding MarR family transcriptional regulator
MDNGGHDRAAKIESLIPRFMRMIYRSTEDSALAQLPLAQTRIIRLLYTGNRTVSVLGEELGLTASAVTQMANRLQDAGLVERTEDLDDKRVKHLALTPRAYEMMRARQARRVARMQTILERLDVDRQIAIVEDLEQLMKAGGEVPDSESLGYVAELEQAIPPGPPYIR